MRLSLVIEAVEENDVTFRFDASAGRSREIRMPLDLSIERDSHVPPSP